MAGDRNTYWKKFYKECYYREFEEFHAKVAEKINHNAQNYILQMKQMVKDFMMHINHFQYMIGQPIGCIELSFLRLSVRKDVLLFALEAFDEKQDMGKCVADYKLELDWFSEEWKALREELLEVREDASWIQYIHKEDIYVMLQDALTILFAELVMLFKYTFETCDTWEECQKLSKSEQFFYISIGEYHDEQKLVYVERKEFDIFIQQEKDTCRYGRFLEKIYRDKRITERDFKGSVFIDCKFEKTIFEQSKFFDTRFYNCYFYKCDMRAIKFYGAVFVNCIFDECDLEGVEWYRDDSNLLEKNDDLYRRTLLKECRIVRSRFLYEKIGECQLLNTDIERDK